MVHDNGKNHVHKANLGHPGKTHAHKPRVGHARRIRFGILVCVQIKG